MSAVDILIIVSYFVVILAIGLSTGRGDRSIGDFYLGGNRMPWIIVTLSILATELSALTYISVPGSSWSSNWWYLQLYPGAIIGKLLAAALFIPAFYAARVTTVYEYLAIRCGPRTRTISALFFVVSRLIGSGLRLLAVAVALSVVFEFPLIPAIIGCAAIAVCYTALGGIKAVIWTDAFQAVVFMAAAIATVAFILIGFPESTQAAPSHATENDKLAIFNLTSDLNDPQGLITLLIFAVLLNAAIFGTDQDLTQRMLTCSSATRGARSLVANAIIGAPVVVLFLLLGTLIWSYQNVTQALPSDDSMNPDHVFPTFIRSLSTTSGLKGLFICGLISAAMSSLDSALSALSSTFVVDFYRPLIAPHQSEDHHLKVGRVAIVVFGMVLVAIAIAFAESGNILQTAFAYAGLIFGPMLGAFLLARSERFLGRDGPIAAAMILALIAVTTFKLIQESDRFGLEEPIVSWPWYIVLSTATTLALAWVFSFADRGSNPPTARLDP